MIIKIPHTFRKIRFLFFLKKQWKPAIIIGIIIVYSAIIFIAGVLVYRDGGTVQALWHSTTDNYFSFVNGWKGFFANPEHISIDIKQKDFDLLAYDRTIALERGKLLSDPNHTVAATIRYKDQTIPIKIRLKGDDIGHIRDEYKWSFRISIKGSETFWGMKEFAIHKPAARNYIYEWILHKALKREGLLGLRYEFLTVTVNGHNLGVYALEEHFDHRLIENNRLRDGPILRVPENLFWDEDIYGTLTDDIYSRTDADVFQSGAIKKDPKLRQEYILARSIFELFRRGEMSTSKTFDTKKLATYLAISELLGAQHGNMWGNERFYYNPITSKFEPIGFDGNAGTDELAVTADIPVYSLYATAFKDLDFFAQYVAELERISQPAYLDSLLKDLQNDLDHNLTILYSDSAKVPSFSKDVLYQNQEKIWKRLHPIEAIRVYYRGQNNGIIDLEGGNNHDLPVKILTLTYKGTVMYPTGRPAILDRKITDKPIDYQLIRFTFPEGFARTDAMVGEAKVTYSLLGSELVRETSIFSWPFIDHAVIDQDLTRIPSNAQTFPFIVIDNARKKIFFKPGSWTLSRSLVIPPGYRVFAGSGTILNTTHGAAILSYSPLEFVGSAEYPVIIYSADMTGQGLAVLNAKDMSIISHVSFKQLTALKQGAWELTAAVQFYESPVTISYSRFEHNKGGDDMINIVRSKFVIDHSSFDSTPSDAVDTDFSEGSITNATFTHIGNDAIDVSGTLLEAKDIFINGTGDKGFSVGEESKARIEHAEMQNVRIGIASKDLSQTTADNVHIDSAKFGLAVYQKKSEFGPGTLHVRGITLQNAKQDYFIQEESALTIGEKRIKANEPAASIPE